MALGNTEIPVHVSGAVAVGGTSASGEPDGQSEVLAGAVSARLLVDAGPGTGKTHVACLRVAQLIREGTPAGRIWIVSFTRTAVLEIRNRIAGALDNPEEAVAVRIATLDSHAWALQSGFDADATLTGGYEDNIAATLGRVRGDEVLQEELERLRHLVIDEAQDIVGIRADLVVGIVDALSERCGVTAFADEAQAIYGFSEEAGEEDPEGRTLPDRLRDKGFQSLSLTHVYRTDCPRLRAIFTDLRVQVLARVGEARERDGIVRQEIIRLAHEDAGPQQDLRLAGLSPQTLVLMRRRMDVLNASSWNYEVPHRLRMSGLPPSIRPWLARLFWDHTARRLGRSEFEQLWASRGMTGAPDAAWSLLMEAAGETVTTVDLARLRNLLGRSSPPVIFCTQEFGEEGPILGTIHASKGREADEVMLYLPQETEEGRNVDLEEEIRVLFVGATRARRKLAVGAAGGRGAGALDDGRAWRSIANGVQVEIGRDGDLLADGLVGRETFAAAEDAATAQLAWSLQPVRTGLAAASKADIGYRFALQTKENQRLGVLSKVVGYDLRKIANAKKVWPPPGFLPHLRSAGVRTMVVRPDDPLLETLHEPWRSSGFLLAPLLTGLSSATFRKGSK